MGNPSYQCKDILKTIFKCILTPIIVVDLNGKIIEMNHAAHKFCNLSVNFKGKNILDFSRKLGTDCVSIINSFLGSSRPLQFDKIICPNIENRDENRYITITTNPLIDDNGKLIGSIIIIYLLDSIDNIYFDKSKYSYFNIIGNSPEMRYIFKLIDRLSNIDSTVLIIGETGTGKELIADALHKAGNRAKKPFIKVNCSALPESLIESELFGSVKGAYTGATKDRIGRIHKADGGTLFLDEIGELSLSAQVKLLRFLQEKEFEKVGSSSTIKVDTKIIAATNKDLQQLVEEGKFRRDLYYRLNVFTIKVPPLRKRKKDIPVLVDYFIKYYSKKFKRKVFKISKEIMDFFKNYYWPGNIRELKHIIEYVAIMGKDDIIKPVDLPKDLHGYFKNIKEKINSEKERILKALEKAKWNKTEAAKMLNMSRRTLYRKLHFYNIL